jgi:ferredoxin-NADP reductase
VAAATQSARVRRVEALSPHVFALDLSIFIPARWQPGQWVSLNVPVGPNPPLVRPYTLARPCDGSSVLPLVFDRVEGGLASTWLSEREPGDTVDVGPVVGKFVLPQEERDLLFVARYTGIVPIRAMLLWLRDNAHQRQVHLVYGLPDPSEAIFHREFVALAETVDWFHYHPTVLQPGGGWPGRFGSEITLLEGLPLEEMDPQPMVSGVRAFTQPARAYLMERLGVERRAVKIENYD